MSEINNKGLKYYSILDLIRFIAALLVIFIHIFPEGSTTSSIGFDNSIPMALLVSSVYSILRPAVPIFFIISSFLLFKRINIDINNKWKYIGHFCLRLLLLYLFWFIVGLPLNARDITGYVSNGDNYNLIRYIVLFFFKGAPRGFWFLVALALSVLITSLFNNKKSLIILLVISGLLYVYGCFNSAYFGIFTLVDNPVSKSLFNVGNYLELSFSILQALLFVVLGKIFAIHDSFKINGNIVYISIAFIFMVGELFITQYYNLQISTDAYFFLPVFVFFFMNKMITIDIKSESFIHLTRKLRKVGTFSYLFHILFFAYMHWLLDAINHNIFREYIALLIIPYIICVLLSFGLQTLFEYLSRYRYLKFLKYSY